MSRSACAWLFAALTILTPCLAHGATASPRTRTASTPAPAPATAPARVSATPRDAAVVLEWTRVPGATRYHVFRATAGVWATDPIATPAGVAFRDAGLTNGSVYSYRVAAANSAGRGPLSEPVTAVPLAPPDGVTAAGGDRRVVLTWRAAAGAATYVVYRGRSPHLETMQIVATGVAGTTFTDEGLVNNTTYAYRVRSAVAGATSAASPAVAGRPVPPPPSDPPSNLVAETGPGRVLLTWSGVERAIGYAVYRTTTGVWDEQPLARVHGLKFRDTAVENGTEYSYRVAAFSKSGVGPTSSEIAVVPLAPPATPGGVTAVAGDGTVTLSWQAAAGADSYTVYRGTSATAKSVVALASVVETNFVDRGVQNGLTYFYQVTASGGGGESGRSPLVSAEPAAPPLVADPASVAAFRLLRQATWGPRPGDVEALVAAGADAFLARQFAAAPSVFPATLVEQPVEAAQEHFLRLALTGDDQLRQRVAWALHKIWVVSAVEVPSSRAIVTYYRLLVDHAFGNYRDLMRAVTLNPAMGRYLNMLNNRSQAVTGTPANENYARELMQLFTLGLTTLNPDGTPVVDSGQPRPAYSEDDVKALARLLTGWTFGDGDPGSVPTRGGRENYGVPMEPVARYHDVEAKVFLGESFPDGQTATQDLEQALDVIFKHPNVGPFVSRQLIQQLVTSNPAPGYVRDVAAVFADNGAGVRGDLAAVVRAILTHPDAAATTAWSGKLAEPVLFVTAALRGLAAQVTDHPFAADKTEAMGQKVFYPPSVFSYFSPGYRVRGTSGPAGPLAGPEFQVLTTVTALERVNFVGALLGGHYGSAVAIDYTPFTTRAADAGALVDYCNLLFMGGRMSPEQRAELVAAVRATPSQNAAERVRTALYLTLATAQAQVDR